MPGRRAAYAFFSYMTQPAQSNSDVTVGGTGFSPYRTSQLSYSDLWKNAGMSEEKAKVYLGAINGRPADRHAARDLRGTRHSETGERIRSREMVGAVE